jgi:hypothetical protein
MDLPLAADCFACGAAVAAGFSQRMIRFGISRLPHKKPPMVEAPARSRGAPLKTSKKRNKTMTLEQRPGPEHVSAGGWLLAGGILAALLLSGDSLSHWFKSSGWLLDMLAAWKWRLAAACSFAILAPLAARRISPLRLRVPVLVLLLVSCGVIAVVQATILPAAVVIHDQAEKRKSAGVAPLNRKLYEYAERKPLRGKIATDDYFIEFLPELNQYYRFVNFPRPATPEFLEGLLTNREVRYMLSIDAAFPPSVVLWMSQHGFQTVFQESGYRFIELPD